LREIPRDGHAINVQRPARHLAKCFACANCIVALVANRVANFVALDVASHHYRLVANPVLTMLPTVLPTKKLASMVALLACRGGVRTFVAACGWRTSLACFVGTLAAVPGCNGDAGASPDCFPGCVSSLVVSISGCR
jgi:hypothetical protein